MERGRLDDVQRIAQAGDRVAPRAARSANRSKGTEANPDARQAMAAVKVKRYQNATVAPSTPLPT